MTRKGVKPNVFTYNSLLQGLFHSGQWKEVTSLFNRMMSEGVNPGSLINALCKEKRNEEAITMLELMIQRDLKPDIVTYNSLIHGLCTSGQWAEATSLFSRMMNEEINPDVVVDVRY